MFHLHVYYRGVIPGGQGGLGPPPNFLPIEIYTLTVTISEVHVDVNIIWSNIQSQAPQHQPTHVRPARPPPPPPNFQIEITHLYYNCSFKYCVGGMLNKWPLKRTTIKISGLMYIIYTIVKALKVLKYVFKL